MSFGTGYHETTRLMLLALPDIIQKDDRIIDAGTGTGILSIAGIKLGAREALAFDIDEWSITNAKENILLNGVADAVMVKKGSADVIPEGEQADIILANIEKNTIIELLPAFHKALDIGGHLLLSGLLKTDEESMREKLMDGFELIDVHQQNEWIAIHAKREKQ
jgi:ribosomal protein L11 methyltransferase